MTARTTRRGVISFLAVVLVACGGGGGGGGGAAVEDGGGAGTDAGGGAATLAPLGAGPDGAITVPIDGSAAVATVDERFLSLAIDTSQVAGGHWWSESGEVEVGVGQTIVDPFDFSRPRLRTLAAALAPAFLRIGGSEADVLYYDLSDDPVETPPEPYELVLTRAMWDGATTFARDLGFDLFVTLNAGPGPRDADGAWTPDNARVLLAHAAATDAPVAVWELGNEVNGFPLIHGLDARVSPEQYATDVARARALVDELTPAVALAGPSSAFWPVSGEAGALYPAFMAAGGGAHIDVVTWHYYASQSRRCPVATRPAGPDTLLEPAHLDEVATWADHVAAERDAHAPGVPVWLGETGHAQCGGEPGVSDRHGASLWWLDQLGLLARRGQPVVVRQTLTGSDYGLIRAATLTPAPDYWASVLWKRLMGTRALAADTGEAPPTVRAWAHCARGGGVAAVVLNLDANAPVTVRLAGVPGARVDRWRMTAPSPTSESVALEGETLALTADGALPALGPASFTLEPGPDAAPWVTLPPVSYAFVVVPDATVAACE